MSFRFDLDRPRSSVPAGPIRGIMPRPVVTPPAAVHSPPAAARPAANGFRPPAAAAASAAALQRRPGRLPYGGRGDPPGPGAGWNACLDWATFGSLDSPSDRELAMRAWMGCLTDADAA